MGNIKESTVRHMYKEGLLMQCTSTKYLGHYKTQWQQFNARYDPLADICYGCQPDYTIFGKVVEPPKKIENYFPYSPCLIDMPTRNGERTSFLAVAQKLAEDQINIEVKRIREGQGHISGWDYSSRRQYGLRVQHRLTKPIRQKLWKGIPFADVKKWADAKVASLL